ncbi:hypothetical protein GCM10010176_040300 [Nonomuraea spiralis]|nr:hypothetical protein GCM10010176_040300 [Nonomuraea spiralis]
MLLSTLLLGGLLTAPPAFAAASTETGAAAVTTAATRVKANPARHSGECPVTVGFSAVLVARGAGTVRYRWVRGDGSKSAYKSVRTRGVRKITVKDRQTFDRTTSGWQAVQILGKKGLSAKARFRVDCAGAPQVWDAARPLPAAQDEPLVTAAAVEAAPPVYSGACPTTVRFTATVQVSRMPARVDYRWIDSATGEGPRESLYFAAGGPRLRQVTLPLSVGSSASGWKAVDLLTPGGHDSGRATYRVTCGDAPRPTPTPTPTPTTTPPPAQKPELEIVSLDPGDYAGDCAEPVEYHALGRVRLPAGPEQQVTYWWTQKSAEWKGQLTFPASTQPRSQDVSATWTFGPKDAGSQQLTLTAQGAAAPATRSFAFTCQKQPDEPTVSIRYLTTPQYKGECAAGHNSRSFAAVSADAEVEMEYRFIVDGVAELPQKIRLRPGAPEQLEILRYDTPASSGSGKVRFEVLSHNRPVLEAPYTWTCVPRDTSDVVRITGVQTWSYVGDCVLRPSVAVHAWVTGTEGTRVDHRSLRDGGSPQSGTITLRKGGVTAIGADWSWGDKPSGTLTFEVLSQHRPSLALPYSATCKK